MPEVSALVTPGTSYWRYDGSDVDSDSEEAAGEPGL